jgi:hypothetical protein
MPHHIFSSSTFAESQMNSEKKIKAKKGGITVFKNEQNLRQRVYLIL